MQAGQEEGLLSHNEILSSEYKLGSKTSTSSALLLYILSPPISSLALSSPSPINSPPSYNIMSQHDLHTIIRQQQEQLAAMQVQIQALIAEEAVVGRETEGSNTGPHMKIARPAIFSGKPGKLGGFITACKLYLRMKMRENTLEEQIQ